MVQCNMDDCPYAKECKYYVPPEQRVKYTKGEILDKLTRWDSPILN